MAAVNLDFVAPDPFDPEHAALFRVLPKERGAERVGPLAGLDLLACVAAATGDSAKVVDHCRADVLTTRNGTLEAGYSQAFSAGSPSNGVETALAVFHGLGPRAVRPVLHAVVPTGNEAGFEAWLTAQKKREDGSAGKVTFNSTSNTTDSRDQADLKVDAELTRWTYPRQLRFKIGAQARFNDDAFEESVTNIVADYDYYFRPWFEIYGFVHRLSNDYLAIDQRWEGGVGTLFEWELPVFGARDGFCRSRGLGNRGYTERVVHLTREARYRMAQYRSAIRRELLEKGFVSAETAEEYCEYRPGIEKRHAVLQLGVALTGLSDFEQPGELTLTATPVDELCEEDEGVTAPDPVLLTPPSSQTFRWSVRPTVTWRPSGSLTLEAWRYYKVADDDAPDGGTDSRSETRVTAEFKLGPQVSLTGSWTRYEDDAPPGFTFAEALGGFDLSAVDGAPGIGVDETGQRFLVEGFTAERDHTVVVFGVAVSF